MRCISKMREMSGYFMLCKDACHLNDVSFSGDGEKSRIERGRMGSRKGHESDLSPFMSIWLTADPTQEM